LLPELQDFAFFQWEVDLCRNLYGGFACHFTQHFNFLFKHA
jgi:hypothetical protein